MRHFDFESIANRMRNRARSGEHRGGINPREMAYIRHCTTRVGRTTLIFSYDAGQHGVWLSDPSHDRCWHLSVSGCDRFERNTWLRAFFGDDLDQVWGQPPETEFGLEGDVWHWRLFCDDRLKPLASIENESDLIAGGLHRAADYGVTIVPADLAA